MGAAGTRRPVREQEARRSPVISAGSRWRAARSTGPAHLRDDADWLAEAWADAGTRVLVIEDGQALVRFGDGAAELVLVPPAQAPEGVRFLLGVDADGIAYFGVVGPPGGLGAGALPPPGTDMAAPEPGVRPASLREAGDAARRPRRRAVDPRRRAGQLARAAHPLPPLRRPTEPAPAGHARRCPVDGSEHFPRIDPAVIMLVTDDDDRCLLARNAPLAAAPGVHPGRVRRGGGVGRAGGRPRGQEETGDRVERHPVRRQPAVADAAEPDARVPRRGRARAADHGRRRGDRRGALVQPRRAGAPRSRRASCCCRRRCRSRTRSSSPGTAARSPAPGNPACVLACRFAYRPLPVITERYRPAGHGPARARDPGGHGLDDGGAQSVISPPGCRCHPAGRCR